MREQYMELLSRVPTIKYTCLKKESIKMKNYVIGLIMLIISSITTNSWASPSGLNNIPTADTVSAKTLVWQFYTDVAKASKPDYSTGFKYGLIENLEIGLDGRIFAEPAREETLKGQVKYRIEATDKLSLALGIANFGDRARNGWEDYYLACTYDTAFLRLHAGGTLQRDNEGGFAGLDKTINFLNRDFTLRSDIIQTNDSHDLTASVGFMYDLGYNFILENWVSFPTESGREDVVTLKLNYVIDF